VYKALIWDIYGTLLLSPEGAIPPEADKNRILTRGFEAWAGFISFHPSPDEDIRHYFELIQEQHERKRRNQGMVFPEIDILLLWQDFFQRFYGMNIDKTRLIRGALLFEKAVNPVVPVTGMAALLSRISGKDIYMGLGSNSQFYTLEFLKEAYPGLFPDAFTPSLFALSYEIGAGKPDPLFYRTLAAKTAALGLSPSEALFIGNDDVNDVRRPAEYGFSSLLFTPGSEGMGINTVGELADILSL